jgi:beta-glucosidase
MNMNMKKKLTLLLSSLCLLGLGNAQDNQVAVRQYPFQNPALSLDARIDDVVSRLSLDEKILQMMNDAPAVDRLGIPAYNWWSEGAHGVARFGNVTVFPQPIAMAATFDPALTEKIASAIGDEARAKFNAAVKNNNRTQYGGLTFWAPNINIFRDPRWGRGMETWGEDPFLTGTMGAAFVRGLQGDDPRFLKAAACAKHYAVHSGPEGKRHVFDAEPSKKDFFETYLPAFRMLVQDAHVEAIMCAYNRTYSEPCCGSKYMLTDILRDKWGFRGHIVTDCDAVQDIYESQHLAKDAAEASAMAVKAGVNLNCGNSFKSLKEAVERGLIAEADIDKNLKILFRTRFKLGLLDPQDAVPFNKIGAEVVNSPKHRQLAYQSALESIVLLKNNGVLPLKNTVKQLFLVGPNAADVDVMLGNYNGVSSSIITIMEGLAGKVSQGTRFEYRKGFLLDQDNKNPINYAQYEANGAEVTIVAMGISPLFEGEEGESLLSSVKSDRVDLEIPKCQIDFLKKIRENRTKPLIAVITGGSPLNLAEVMNIADAVLFVWYPGEEGGNAIADVILGNASPSGKLPITFPKSVSQLPPYEDYGMKGRTYRYMEQEPLFPFGFGLSYAKFEFSDIKVDQKEITASGSVHVSATVANKGAVESDEVVQLYLTQQIAGLQCPLYSLKGFTRVHLKAGESTKVDFTLNAEKLMVVNNDGEQMLVPGKVTITIADAAPSQRAADLGAATPVKTVVEIK